MRLEDYKRKEFDDVYGFYDRGQIDQVPEGYFSDCLNLDFNKGEWKTRVGISTAINLATYIPVRFINFADPTIGPITILLDSSGNFYTFSARSSDAGTSIRFTVAGCTDFSAIKMYGRIYIAPHTGEYGVSAQTLRVFIPHTTTVASDEFRNAAGLAPTAAGAIGAANGAAGVVNAGTYKIAVAYITTSGFVTKPGPEVASVFTATTYVSPGSVKIDLTSIPTGPSGTSSRQIIITKAGLEEYYFLPTAYGGVIADNTTTTATLNFDDTTDLVDSADYLFDLLTTIPAPLVLQEYNSKLVTGGEAAIPSILRVSRNGEPEAFDSVNGIVTVNKDDGFTIRNLNVMRDVLYAWKNLGLYSIRDNGDDPSTWGVNTIDQSVNVGVHGISQFFDMSGVRMARDWTLIADKSGILLFDGILRKPPITENIDDLWQSINYSYYHNIVLVVDEHRHKIYCVFPDTTSTVPNKFIMGDYGECPGNVPEANTIKWSIWSFKPAGTSLNMGSIGMFSIPNPSVGSAETVPVLKMASTAGTKVWSLDTTVTMDQVTGDIESYFETGLLYFDSGMVHFFTAVRMRVIGSGSLLLTIRGEDNVLTGTLTTTTLSTAPGVEQLVRFNFQNEKARLKFRLTTGNFTMSKVEFFGKPVYSMRPS